MTDEDHDEEMNWLLQMGAEDNAVNEDDIDWPLLRGDD